MLLADRPHTAPLLRFYLSLLELQTAVCAPIDVAAWLPAVEAAPGTTPPALLLERLPLAELTDGFAEFCRGVPDTAPEPVAVAASGLAGTDAHTRADLLQTLLRGGDPAETAGALGCAPAPLTFLSRGFLSPLAEALARLVSPGAQVGRPPGCPRCGWPPQVSRLEDEPDAQGTRRLVCAFCATDWTFPRAVCPACGVSGDKGLELHVDDALTHVRVEACRTCRRYLKSVDLRVVGLGVPLVDDLATPELDLWAAEQGLEKIVPNLFDL